MQEEIKQTVFIGIGLLLLSAVLLFARVAIDARDSFADTKNNAAYRTGYMSTYKEFSKYDGYSGYSGYIEGNTYYLSSHNSNYCQHDMSGAEVIELIRKYCESSIYTIYIDKDKNGSEMFVGYEYYKVNKVKYSLQTLQLTISESSTYHPYLIFNGSDIAESSIRTAKPRLSGIGNNICGVKLLKIN